MQTQIVAIGNSFGLRLPKPVLDALHLEKTSHVSIQLRKDSIVLRPAPKPKVKTNRSGWFDVPFDAKDDDAEFNQDWQALDAAVLNDAALDAQWQW
jgi:antitoxin component of MazEF toxin-antitoxin module